MEDVRSTREPLLITKRGKPVAKLVPVGAVKGKRQPGSWKGKFVLGPEFFEPMSESELAEWE